MTDNLDTYEVRLFSKGFYDGELLAKSEQDAIDQVRKLWAQGPHPFEKTDEELTYIEATLIRKAPDASIDGQLNSIAAMVLNIKTLETRNAGNLDFHELPVWGIKAALRHAFDAGIEAAKTGKQS